MMLRYCKTHGYFMDCTSDPEADEYDPCWLPGHESASSIAAIVAARAEGKS
jgi:hypothetical protein